MIYFIKKLTLHDLEMKGVEPRKSFNIEEHIEKLTFQNSLLQKTCEVHYYKNLSHFKDMVKNMSNEPNKITPCHQKKTNYIIITDQEGGHTGQQADYITLQQAKKTIKW